MTWTLAISRVPDHLQDLVCIVMRYSFRTARAVFDFKLSWGGFNEVFLVGACKGCSWALEVWLRTQSLFLMLARLLRSAWCDSRQECYWNWKGGTSSDGAMIIEKRRNNLERNCNWVTLAIGLDVHTRWLQRFRLDSRRTPHWREENREPVTKRRGKH
jgi:hypothetical protein